MRDRDSQSRFEAFKEDVELNCQFINAKANTSVKDKIVSGDLENEAVAKAAYKARVVNHLLSTIPWCVLLTIWARNSTHCMQDDGNVCFQREQAF